MSLKQQLRMQANRVLGTFDLTIARPDELAGIADRYLRLVRQFLAVAADGLPPTPGREAYVAALMGTDVPEGVALLKGLHDALTTPGEVCEFGVAQGATSALLANELIHHGPDRQLWLYDSFKGFAKPSGEDVLLDDLLGLGDIVAYEGQFAIPRAAVETRLAAVEGWTPSRTRIVEGFFTAESELPVQVAFAYIDFDMYQPIRDALEGLHTRTVPGSVIIVDDYGYFSAGAQTAVDQFLTAYPGSYRSSQSPDYSDPHMRLDRTI